MTSRAVGAAATAAPIRVKVPAGRQGRADEECEGSSWRAGVGAAAHVGAAFEQDGRRHEVVAAASDVPHLHERYRNIE